MTTPESQALNTRLQVAVEIARQAGELTLEYFRTADLDVDRKTDGSPVTAADRAAEQLLRQRIGEQFPHDAILGEEFGETPGSSGYRWTLDPIDGTKSFVAGVPLYTTLVAVLHEDDSQIGVIFAPAAGEMVYAARGEGCWHVVGTDQPRRCQVSAVENLADALFVTTAVRSFTTYRTPDARPVYDQLQSACRITRTWGDAYGHLLVATGRADIMIDPALNLWDAAPLQTIIEEAGGRFLDWQGQSTIQSGEGFSTNSALQDQVLSVIREKAAGGKRKG